ncbi:hypothetical protein G9464_14295 [Halostella sp. JP-L12]|uniref:hypothetical protein n=1 Tax=Halostella TaxID=1843185 RepID=UPI000EF81CCC|nr:MULTISPECIES: hypothetical protein [Halostella]NHN48755.1 hypothetical protein [Halostella sp. JP-L12]
MIEVEVVDATVRAVDRRNNAAEVETVGWDEVGRTHSFPQQIDAAVGGRVTELTLPSKYPQLAEVDADGTLANRTVLDSKGEHQLSRGNYQLRVEPPIRITVRFEGPATVTTTDDDEVSLSFEQPERVSIGFLSFIRVPRQTITVPPTTRGLAAAVTNFSAALQRTDSARAMDEFRRHPPRIAFGDEIDVPAAVTDFVPETDLVVRVPDRMDALFHVAPLAYYLGARVEVGAGDPLLYSPGTDFRHSLAPPPEFRYDAATLLRRVFLLDSLVQYDRNATASPEQSDLLSLVDLDTARCDDYSDVERLRAYLDVDFGRISPALPEWHFVSYVEPTPENATALPYLLRYLPVILHPDSDRGRGTDGAAAAGEVADLLPDRLATGAPHGSAIAWMADDAESEPVADWFRPIPAAYEHASAYLDRSDGTGRVVVVCNDPSRRSVRDGAAALFRRHGPDSVEVETRDAVPRADLAALFERGADFVHFVGDCAGGLDCPDGRLRPDRLEASNARLFFLDGPGSVETGFDCVRSGSVGGFALDGDRPLAPAVRERLLGLFARGFTVDQARRYAVAAGESDPADGAGLRAVGDGFQQLVRNVTLYCTPATVEPIDDNLFDVEAYPYIPEAGFVWRPELRDLPARFCAAPSRFAATGPELRELIETENLVPTFDGTVHWRGDEDLFYPFV